MLLLVLENPFNNYHLNNANYTNTTMMDLVFTFDKEANDNIKSISARNWFSEKEKYFNDYGINNKFKVCMY